MNNLKITLILLSMILMSCANIEDKSIANNEILAIEKEIGKSQSDKDQKQEPVSLVIDNNLLLNGQKQALDSNHTRRKFDVAVDNISARLFFANLMSDAKSNIVLHPDVTGNITLNLKQVTLEDVLSIVRDVYGYDYKYQNNIYTIYAKKLRTEIFPINYIDVKRVGVSDTSVLTGNVESTTQSDSESNQAQEADLVGAGTSIVPGARIQTHTETDFWSSLQESIAEIVGVSEAVEGEAPSEDGKGRKVIVNSQTGVAVVTAMPDELAAVRQFLTKAQLNVRKQVIIEAKILEIELSDDYQAGINWNQINGQLLLTKNVSEFTSPINITSAAEGVGEVFSSLIKISDLSQLLSLLKTQGSVQVLSSPRVSTVNNQKAVIRVGSDRFFVTGISNSTTTSSGSTTNNPEIELSSFFSGISLDVTPQIDDKGEVILHIHPVISSVTEEQKDITVGDQSFSLPLALRDIRESDSIVRAESGQIVVLGGLMQEKLMSVKGKRPVLGDIPVLNNLFKTSAQNRVKSELIILLKPIVIGEQGWAAEITKSTERIKQNIN